MAIPNTPAETDLEVQDPRPSSLHPMLSAPSLLHQTSAFSPCRSSPLAAGCRGPVGSGMMAPSRWTSTPARGLSFASDDSGHNALSSGKGRPNAAQQGRRGLLTARARPRTCPRAGTGTSSAVQSVVLAHALRNSRGPREGHELKLYIYYQGGSPLSSVPHGTVDNVLLQSVVERRQ